MKIVFILPFSGRKPVGGVKVVYEYANNLVGFGHDVLVIHPAGLYMGVGENDRWYRNIVKFFLYGLTNSFGPSKWLSINPMVKIKWVPCLASYFVPRADIVFATSWETAEWVASYPKSRGDKFYLIQGLETWSGESSRVINTWKLPLKKVVISKWLEDFARSIGQTSCYIPNGLDFNAFGVDIVPENRKPCKILMLYHTLPLKGTMDGVAALSRVRAEFPEIEVVLFGVDRPGRGELPNWISFEYRPSKVKLRSLFNESAIFVSPSWSEGWALPPAEAMQCGCATVLTDIGGHEYAIKEETSLLSPPHDIDGMSENILRLLRDNALRIRLARQGMCEIEQYIWLRSSQNLLSYVKQCMSSKAMCEFSEGI